MGDRLWELADRVVRETLAAIEPGAALGPGLERLASETDGPIVVISIGKAAAGMARAAVERLGTGFGVGS